MEKISIEKQDDFYFGVIYDHKGCKTFTASPSFPSMWQPHSKDTRFEYGSDFIIQSDNIEDFVNKVNNSKKINVAINPKDIKDTDKVFIKEWNLSYSGLFCKQYKQGLLLNGLYTLYMQEK